MRSVRAPAGREKWGMLLVLCAVQLCRQVAWPCTHSVLQRIPSRSPGCHGQYHADFVHLRQA